MRFFKTTSNIHGSFVSHLVSIKLLVVFGIPLLLSSCGESYKSSSFTAEVNDSINLISSSTKNWIKSNTYPSGFPLIIQTKDSVPEIKIGVSADDAFDESAGNYSTPKAFKKRGILIFITRKPNLIQLRVGKEIRLLCQWKNISAGDQYLSFQKRFQKEPDSVLKEFINWLAIKIPEKTDIAWYKKLIYNEATGGLINEVDEYQLPSENFYGETIIKPTLELRIFERSLFKGWWITYLVVAFIIYCLNHLLSLFFKKIISPNSSITYRIIHSIVRLSVLLIVNLFFIVPSIATASLMSGARLEDQLALKATNMPGAESVLFKTNTMFGATGVLLAILVVIVVVIGKRAIDYKILKNAILPKDKQVRIFNHIEVSDPVWAFLLVAAGTRTGRTIHISDEEFRAEPFTHVYNMGHVDAIKSGIILGLLCWIFLPLYITYAVLFLHIPKIIIGGFMSVRVLLKHKEI
jgi:hypothetical protein